VSRARLTAAMVALAAAGMLRILWLHFVSEPLHVPVRAPIDRRYEALRRLVPSGVAGYVSDEPAGVRFGQEGTPEGTRLYLQAQFALAPLVLRYDDASANVVIANLADPARLPEVLRQRGLALVAAAGPGMAVARPR
jgi:hypothetical protein